MTNPDETVRKAYQFAADAVTRASGRNCYWLCGQACHAFLAFVAIVVVELAIQDGFSPWSIALNGVILVGCFGTSEVTRREAARLQAALLAGRPALAQDDGPRMFFRWSYVLILVASISELIFHPSAACLSDVGAFVAIVSARWWILCDPAPPRRSRRLAAAGAAP